MVGFEFKEKLVEGVVKSRPNRFIMMVVLKGKTVKCHCPSTGRIGGLSFEGIPCLLSKGDGVGRKTAYTVEAISLDPVEKKSKEWIGINQVKANDYVNFFLGRNQLSKIFGVVEGIKREVKLRDSRIDFLVNGRNFLEVKTMLMDLPCEGHPNCRRNKSKFVSFERMIRHFNDVSHSISHGSRAVFLLCYLYDARGFEVPKADGHTVRIKNAAKAAARRGVETWQLNLEVSVEGVRLLKYFKLDLF